MSLDATRLSNARRSIAALRLVSGSDRNGRDEQMVHALEGLSHRASFPFTIQSYTLDANHIPRSFGPARLDGVSDLPTRTHNPAAETFEVRLSAAFPHVTPMVPYKPSAAHVARVKSALGAESMSITAHLNPSVATGPFNLHGAPQRRAAQSMALRAAGSASSKARESQEDLGSQMQHPPAPASGTHAWNGAAPAAGAASSRGRRLGASYTDADVAVFRSHYDAVGRYFAERIGVATAHRGAREDSVPGGRKAEEEQTGRAAAEPREREEEDEEGDAAPPPHCGAAAHWARTPLGRCTPRTVELVTSLAAFRVGLQELEAHRRRRNDELNRDPSDWARVTAGRSVPPGWDAPFAH